MRNDNPSRTGTGQLVTGALVIAIGVLFLLDNLDIINVRHAITFWPVVFIVAGLVKLFDTGSPNNYLVGGILVAIGAALVCNRLGLFYLTWGMVWPLFLIVAGALFMYRAFEAGRRRDAVSAPQAGATWTDAGAKTGAAMPPSDAVVDISAILGGFERSVTSQAFRGGDITAILGGCSLDMRAASIEGEAVLNVFAFMGGVTIKCPPDWTVVLHGSPILGGFEEKTAHPPVATKRLVVTGYAILGGVEVRN